ncbi:ABC transporter permease, partial [Ruminococcaceae bacterium OttesenSCG-928-O06]|nr:ABC transporter permease [Ruminococcaceae bacterium OttesenSCG-928-O06]
MGKKLLQGDGFYSFLSALLSIIVGILIGFIILLVSNPSQAVNGLLTILKGGFSSMRDLGQVLYNATPIIMTGLSVGFANKCGLFNIGTPGQFIVGGYVAVYIGV